MLCGGPVVAALGMTSALARAGVDVRLVTTDRWSHDLPEKIECETEIFPNLVGPWQWSPKLGRALPELVRWADVVNLHTLWNYPVAAAARASARAGVPYILRPCGMMDEWSLTQKNWKKRLYTALIERKTINNAAALWFTSEDERKGAQHFNYVAADAVIPLGIAQDVYRELPPPNSFRQQFPELKERRLILFLGRITPKKRTDLLLKSFASVHEEFPETALVIAGPDEGTCLKDLKELAESLRVADRVHFLGPLQGREVQAAFVDSDIFVLPSLHENFGVSVIEAMACGLPVIVSNSVNLSRQVAEADAGLTINLDVESLKEALRKLLADPSLSLGMGERGRKLVLERFTWEGIVPELIDLYEKAIARKLTARPVGNVLAAGETRQLGEL